MPISGPSSYPPTVDDFLEHWDEVNAALGASELVLSNGQTRGDLLNLRTALEDARDAVTDLTVDRPVARGALDLLIADLQARTVEFNERVRADLPGNALVNGLINAFKIGDPEDVVRDTLRKVSRLWVKINALPPGIPGLDLPLVMQDGRTLADLDGARAALRLAYVALSDTDVDLRVARGRRNNLQDEIYPILKDYRRKVPTKFPAGHAFVESLPALTPAPGSTPDAVAAEAVWVPASTQAKITWAASTEASLDHYEVRGVAGDSYLADDEVVLASVGKGAAREFLTPFALGTPGVTAGFKVYVVLDTGNERGSEPVYVTRPVGVV